MAISLIRERLRISHRVAPADLLGVEKWASKELQASLMCKLDGHLATVDNLRTRNRQAKTGAPSSRTSALHLRPPTTRKVPRDGSVISEIQVSIDQKFTSLFK